MRHDFAKICLLLFLSLLPREAWAVRTAAEDRELFFSEISVKDGLSQGFVHSIAKDSRGFIWVGTSGGLNRWDGYSFIRYKHSPADSLSLGGNLVNCIAEDSDGFLWLGTGNGLCRFDPRTDRFRRYHSRDSLEGSISGDYVKSLLFDSRGRLWVGADGALNRYDAAADSFVSYDCGGLLEGTRIYDILEDRRGILWLATRDAGLISFDPETVWCVRYAHDPSDPCSISSNHVCCLHEDGRGALWIGTWEHGINIYDRRRDIFLKAEAGSDGKSPNSNQIRCFSEDGQGRMWVGTSDGLSIYSPETGLWSYCKRHNDVPGTLSYNIINCMYADGSGAVWLGTHGGGISLYHPALGQFRLIDPKMETGRDYGYVGPMVEIDGDIWTGTEGGGLGRWSPGERKYTFYNMRRGGASESSWNTVRALCADRNGLLWVGTYAGGVLLFNPRTGTIVSHYGADEGLGNSIINEIFEDSRGNLWVGSNSDVGLYCRRAGSKVFERHVSEFEDGAWGSSGGVHDFPWVRTICERKNGELWLGSISSGVMVKPQEGPARHFSVRNSRLSSNSVSCVVEDSRGIMWVGTYGGGVNVCNPETGEFRVYDSGSGLGNDNVCSIVEDGSGKVWVGTVAGISVYDPESGTFSEYSYSKGNFPIETLNLKSGLRTSSGHLWFGGSNGIAEFLPESVPLSGAVPPVAIVSVTAGDRKLHPSDRDSRIESTVPYLENLVLDYRQADFTVEFAALNYVNAGNNSYSFLLEGYDRDWSVPSHERRATYTNLPAGDYVFRVRTVRDGLLSGASGTELAIRILPPPWKRWWAYLLYVLFSLGAAGLAAWYAAVRIRGRNELRVRELEQETKERMHREQMNVFTNFSHELRTPLTLIIDPLRGILLDESLPAPLRKSLKLIQSNADRILTLVNQLMDFRRQDSGQMKLRARQSDIVGFAEEMTVIFGEQTRARGISLSVSSSEPSLRLCFDRFLMEKVFFNLLSNAVKNTPEGGEIRLSVSRFGAGTLPESLGRHCPEGFSAAAVLVEVDDSGRGIPEDDLERIFAPFYRVDERRNGDLYGTGIGLHLTKSIVEMHGGVIWAENLPDRGASFRILLPERGPEPETGDGASSQTASGEISETAENDAENAPSALPDAARKHRILIADDNQDIRSYISDSLRTEYDTAEAENGKQALAKASEWHPDLVVCDIIMPEMDGLELLRRLKSSPETSRIPVILLTARTSVEQTREGLRAGADDYVTKPFDVRLLKTRIDSLIENRVHLKEMFLKEFSVELSEGEMNHTDRYFLSRAYDYVKDNLADENLSIEGFGRSLHLSRTQLYRKIKALTGLSPSAFVSELRLKIAASLLSETNLNVSEVAYKVGFSSPSYFTTSFRRLYGMSPKEYAARRQTPSSKGNLPS